MQVFVYCIVCSFKSASLRIRGFYGLIDFAICRKMAGFAKREISTHQETIMDLGLALVAYVTANTERPQDTKQCMPPQKETSTL